MMKRKYLISTLFLLFSPLAMAHPGHLGNHSFSAGFLHPMTGLDHLAVMLGVGILAAMLGGNERWKMPLSFIALMVVGATLGVSGILVPGVETFIALSVLVMGIMLCTGSLMPKKLALGLIMVFAVFHGMAHGAEMPVNSQTLHYFSGFVLATATLHIAGIAIGEVAMRLSSNERFCKAVGVVIALLGGSFLLS